jgi:hypothetical protein
MNRAKPAAWLAGLCVLLLWPALSAAQAFSYLGTLTDAQGQAADGPHDFRVRLFSAETNGSELAPADEHAGVDVQAGSFALELDFGLAILAAPDAWLQLEVRAVGEPDFDVQTPRQRVTGVPLALFAQSAGSVAFASISGLPAGLADGVDNDTLAQLACADGELPRYQASSGQWQCGSGGIDGRTLLSAAGAPDAALGAEGDFYIDTAATEIYGPKSASGWGDATDLVGPAGPQGPQGLAAGVEPVPAASQGSFSYAGAGPVPPMPALPLHDLRLTLERSLQAGAGGGPTLGPLQVTRAEVVVDAGTRLPQLARASVSQGPVGTLTVSVPGPAGDLVLVFTQAFVLSIAPVDNGAASPTLARIEIQFTTYSITLGGFTSAYNFQTAQITALPAGGCAVIEQTFNGRDAPADPRIGTRIEDDAKLLASRRSVTSGGGMGGSAPMFDPVQMRHRREQALDPEDAAVFACASDRLLRATPLASIDQQYFFGSPASPLREYSWQNSYFTRFALSLEGGAGPVVAWTFQPQRVELRSGTAVYCYDIASNVNCSP